MRARRGWPWVSRSALLTRRHVDFRAPLTRGFFLLTTDYRLATTDYRFPLDFPSHRQVLKDPPRDELLALAVWVKPIPGETLRTPEQNVDRRHKRDARQGQRGLLRGGAPRK